jgi:outer membrane lipoprotein-sorting protein
MKIKAIVVAALIAFGAQCGAVPLRDLPPGQLPIARELSKYMDSIEHMRADFTQFNGKSTATGVVTVDFPRSVKVEYKTPKYVTITYDSTERDTVRYYDHRLKQERRISARFNALQLLLEESWQDAVDIINIDMFDTLYVTTVAYKGESLVLSFAKNPIELRSIRVSGKVRNRKATVNMELRNIEHLDPVKP